MPQPTHSISSCTTARLVEVEWQTASAAGANDGYVKFWINDVLVDTLSGLDTDARNVTKAVIGAAAGVDAGTAGTVFWDGFELNVVQYPQSVLKLTVYTLSPEKSWLTV